MTGLSGEFENIGSMNVNADTLFDVDFFNRAAGCPHTILDTGAFQCRTGRARRRINLVFVAHQNFTVGADVDNQRRFLGEIGLFR